MTKEKKVGRPSKIDKAVVGKLREAFLMGCTDAEACQYADIDRSILYDYQKKYPEFTDQKEQWKSSPVLKAKKTVFDNLDKIGVAQWYLEKKCPDEFVTKQKQEVSGNIGLKPLDINIKFVDT